MHFWSTVTIKNTAIRDYSVVLAVYYEADSTSILQVHFPQVNL